MSAVPTTAAPVAAETISLPRVLARRLALPALFLVATAYHFYMMSEALAYPVFLLAVAVLTRALDRESRWSAVAVPTVCALAIGTRIQFVVLPLAYFAAVAVCGRGAYRRHLVPVALTAVLVTALLGLPGLLGQYGQSNFGHATP